MGDPVRGLEFVHGGEGISFGSGVDLDDDQLAVFADGDGAESFFCDSNIADCGDDCGGWTGDEDFKDSWLSCGQHCAFEEFWSWNKRPEVSGCEISKK